ncbi:MAG: hypothetical protein MJZ64_00410 [Paludibacteraceae bacterium]|nr:hypothetical protein [Paludibacteraceae bacterium]
MSFKNTQTPRKPTTPARYQIPKVVGQHGVMTYQLEGELKERFIRYFPTHTNREMMELFGIAYSPMQRFKRELGLKHNKRAIIRKQAEITKRICEQNGYYDSLRGVAPSEACKVAAKAKRDTGWHPLDEVRKNKRRWARLKQRRSEKRKDIVERERKRVDWGLPRHTNLHMPFVVYNRRQVSIRYTMQKRGYVVGNAYDETERMHIFYTAKTQRSTIVENHAEQLHFTITALWN